MLRPYHLKFLARKIPCPMNINPGTHCFSIIDRINFHNTADLCSPNVTNSKKRTFIDTLPPDKLIPIAKSHKVIGNSNTEWRVIPSAEFSNIVDQYLKLSKFRLTSLVVITSMAGYAVAPAPFELASFTYCALGTGLLSSAANSINQFHEVPFDAQMSRTKNRVLVCGNLTPTHAIAFAVVAGSAGFGVLMTGVNDLTAYLGLGNLFLYTSVYTPLKRISILNTWVGSFVGAIPPLMGWAACASTLSPGALVMAGLLYCWQFPHFNALSWNLRPDYSRAGYRMMAVTNPGLCRRTALRYTIGIQALSCISPLADVTNWWFVLESSPLNLYFLYLAYKFYQRSDSKTSRQLFRFSLLHLPLLMLLLLINKKNWFIKSKENTATRDKESKLSLPTAVANLKPTLQTQLIP